MCYKSYYLPRRIMPRLAELLSIFSSGGHFVQQSQTILAMLIKVHERNISEKLF